MGDFWIIWVIIGFFVFLKFKNRQWFKEEDQSVFMNKYYPLLKEGEDTIDELKRLRNDLLKHVKED